MSNTTAEASIEVDPQQPTEFIYKDPLIYTLNIVYDIVRLYSWMPIVIVGLVGNVISICITLRKDNRRISTCNFMTALAMADSSVLIELTWGMAVFHWTTDPPSEFVMQMMWYQAYNFGIISGVLLAEMTVDRLIVVRFPMAAKRLCTARRAKITIAMTFIIVSGLNLYIFFTYVKEEGKLMLRMSVPEAPYLETLGYALQLSLGTVSPFCVIVLCNVWIVITLRSAAKNRLKMGVNEKDTKALDQETTHLTRMLILVSLAYVLTSIPYRLYVIIIAIPEVDQIYNMDDQYWGLRLEVQHFIIYQVWNMNYGINFYLYCIGGGKKYRNDVQDLFKQVFKVHK